MRFKSFTLLAMVAFWGLVTKAQTVDHSISFNETTHDFGTVKLNDKTETVFKFKNISNDTLRLTGVKASCGCTTPKWTQEVVKPGESGEIQVSYNSSKGGAFNKSVTVTYSDRPEPVILYIKGEVIGDEANNYKPEGSMGLSPAPSSINYSIPRGGIAFEKMIENVKSLTSDDIQSVEFRIKNTSGADIKFLQDKTETESGVTVAFNHLSLKPGQESSVKVSLDGKKFKADGQADGFFSKRVTIVTDEANEPKKQLSINGSYTRILTEAEKATSPKIEFETVDINGGKIIEGEKFVIDFKFKNTGGAPLIIESAKASCGCTATAPPVENIQPNGASAITATFDSRGRLGIQSKSITVKSNDVTNPVVTLKFTVEVVKDPFHAGSMMGGGN